MANYLGVNNDSPSFGQTTASQLTMSGPFFEASADNITAFAGGGKAGATVLKTQTVRVTTVATNGDSVLLPASVAGYELLVINHGANSMQVFGAGTDTIDDIATATGAAQMANSLVIYSCATAGSWYSEGLASGYGGPGLQTSSYANAITAFAGGGQASATLLGSMINRVTVVATIADSVKMPATVPGLVINISNAAANSMNVFPNTGDAINGAGANVAFAVAGGKSATLTSAVAGQWHAVLSA